MKKVIFYISTALAAAYVVAAFFWTGTLARQEKCGGIAVEIHDDGDSARFVSDAVVRSALKRLGISVKGAPLDSVDTYGIERALDSLYYVEYVECYKRSDNMVALDVYPVKPVLRVFDASGSYYINRRGKRVPSSPEMFVDVPVAYGNFTEEFPPLRLLPLVDYLSADPAAADLVSAISVADSNNVYVVPNIAGQVINLGSLDGLDKKFAKLRRFYREVLPVKGWGCYDTVSLKWNGQIVAVKRDGKPRLWVQESDSIGHEEMPLADSDETAGGGGQDTTKTTN